MRRRRIGAALLALPVVSILTGCIAPQYGGVRLNADGTVDYVVCYRHNEPIYVNYLGEDDQGSDTGLDEDEWRAIPKNDVSGPTVIEYGLLPNGYGETVPPEDPPLGWTRVDTPGGYFLRSELTEGEWYWNNPNPWAWIPNHPCSGYEIGPDGDPREVP
jgi:hypothetical protein